MSLWIRRRDQDGNAYHYLVPFDPFLYIVVFATVIGTAFLFMLSFLDVAQRLPIEVGSTIVGLSFVGFVMIAFAKCSVIRMGVLMSFGPSKMNQTMKRLYFTGYLIFGCSVLLTALFVSAVR